MAQAIVLPVTQALSAQRGGGGGGGGEANVPPSPWLRPCLAVMHDATTTKLIVNKVGMAVQRSKQTRVAGITAYKYGHPSYICYQSVSDCIKDVGMSTCKLLSLLLLFVCFYALPSLLYSQFIYTSLCYFCMIANRHQTS